MLGSPGIESFAERMMEGRGTACLRTRRGGTEYRSSLGEDRKDMTMDKTSDDKIIVMLSDDDDPYKRDKEKKLLLAILEGLNESTVPAGHCGVEGCLCET